MSAHQMTAKAREQSAQLAAIRKVRDRYADQAMFAEIEASVHFTEFVRLLDLAVGKLPRTPQATASVPHE